MIEIMPESKGRMLAVRASKKLTESDYAEVWIPALQKVIEEHKSANVLLYMDENFEGWELKAMWEDAKFGFAHRNDFNKIAIAGGPAWVEWGSKIASALINCELKIYEPEKLSESLIWVAK
ncbi:STAS/SEC14 domain-containing protein [Maridesulfovibrio ferrireducens]|uniref:STAS/SEC14 domain-containing protein n=1 Tax=Maridesulfovibrio ferrireducens TaxID=246191 RepID=UPI001A229A64|nr:STAS/SEC14 domain-containing protein [Maridesulfovibrio ferrireducens]MBI9109706.1 STAS/SEC14 domain-containing protein [Maridesulfovibrio ferrireducens]